MKPLIRNQPARTDEDSEQDKRKRTWPSLACPFTDSAAIHRIWERKYGKNAKHVKKATEREMDTEEARQKAKAEKEIEHLKKTGRYVYGVESNLTKPAEGKTQRTWTAAVQSDTANDKMAAMLAAESDAKAKRQATSNTIHPSWEARKKAKEAQANLASAKPAGKKIVFD